MQIINAVVTGQVGIDGKMLSRVEGFVNDVEDLPIASDAHYAEGSIMYVTHDSDFYVLDSIGTWCKKEK